MAWQHSYNQAYSSLNMIAVTLIIVLLTGNAVPADDSRSYLIGGTVRSDDLGQFHKWNIMVKHYVEQQKTSDAQCDKVAYHPCEILRWKTLVKSLMKKPFAEQLKAINDYANSFPYTTPMQNWNKEDYWETPYEFLQVSGNCKDYAIIKYFSLRMLGIPEDRLRLIVLKDTRLGALHAVLGVYEGNKLYILDNQSTQVMLAEQIYNYLPIYAINENTWWLYRKPS